MKASSVVTAVRSEGVLGLLQTNLDRFAGTTSKLAAQAQGLAASADALEVGGPSARFRRGGALPLYDRVRSLDNVNFADVTMWEGELSDGTPYRPAGEELGRQFIREATTLDGVEDSRYGLIMSSHCLEHVANPLAALREWRRVATKEASLVLILPHRDGTFDRRRAVTTIEHLRDDEHRSVGEDDPTHFDEVLRLHDLRKDPGASSPAAFAQRVRDNRRVRGIHHHVFDVASAIEMVNAGGWSVMSAEGRRPYDIILLAGAVPMAEVRPRMVGSVFASDRGSQT